MKKKLLSIAILLLIIGGVLKFALPDLFKPSTVRAVGDLIINFHVPENDPIFVVENMLPGDTEDRNIDVSNGGTIPRMISVKGVRTGGVGATPKLETVLTLVIKDGATPIYGAGSVTGGKTLQDFFDESQDADGVQLNVINPGNSKTYNFEVFFPHSAGNEFQLKSVIFDLIFENFVGDNIVINEVFYRVDATHGFDSPKDRGIVSVNGNNVVLNISGNGAGSNNTINVSQSTACTILQSNNTNISNNVVVNSNTGGNSIIRNVFNGIFSIITGNSNVNVNISNSGNTNTANLNCGSRLGQNDEWVELFNPTDHPISLKNWSLTDNSGTRIINANKTIPAGGFAILSKSASTWNFWNENPSAVKVELGGNIGDGLDNAGDHLILKAPSGTEADRMSWGSDTSGFTPPGTNPLVPLGSSTERLTPGFDTDAVTDWEAQNPPSPGN